MSRYRFPAAIMLVGFLALAGCPAAPRGEDLTKGSSEQTPSSFFSTSPLPPVYSADAGNGAYKNPIIFADYSDPDVCRVADDYYMTASSFSCFPGLPILHSRDLVNWTLIGHAVMRYPEPFDSGFNAPQHGSGIWAPAIRYHNNTYFIFFGDPDNGIFMTQAKDPAGPWSPLVQVKAAKGWIDTCPFWDDDAGAGSAYLVHAYARSRAGMNNRLDICRMSLDGSKLLDDGTSVFNGGSDPPSAAGNSNQPRPAAYTTVEGPKLYKRGAFYYLFAPGGGVTRGYQIVFRSKNILGPYESRIVLEQGATPINGPHQGAWIDVPAPGGKGAPEDWFIHFQDRGPYGRVTCLEPMRWADDWPILGTDPTPAGAGHPVLSFKKPNVGRPYPPAAPQTSDEFESQTIGLQWQWFGNFQPEWASTAHAGVLRLTAVSLPVWAPLYNRPNLLLQKFPAEEFTVTTKLDPSGLEVGESAGLVIVGRTTASLAIRKRTAGYQIARTHFQAATAAGAEQPPDADQASAGFDSAPIYLRAKVTAGARCSFSYSLDNQIYTPLGQPFTAATDQWIGAKIGLFCNAPPPILNPPITQPPPKNGYADFDFFHVQP